VPYQTAVDRPVKFPHFLTAANTLSLWRAKLPFWPTSCAASSKSLRNLKRQDRQSDVSVRIVLLAQDETEGALGVVVGELPLAVGMRLHRLGDRLKHSGEVLPPAEDDDGRFPGAATTSSPRGPAQPVAPSMKTPRRGSILQSQREASRLRRRCSR
jgi:hypothetical protein